jgi:gas vesicle protein
MSLESPAIINELFSIIKTYGPELSILFVWIFILIRSNSELNKDLKQERALREQLMRDNARELLELSKENIETMGSITRLVESLAPAISDVSGKIQHDFEIAVSDIKEHITNNSRTIERIINACAVGSKFSQHD